MIAAEYNGNWRSIIFMEEHFSPSFEVRKRKLSCDIQLHITSTGYCSSYVKDGPITHPQMSVQHTLALEAC
jgi:hypothetical protein